MWHAWETSAHRVLVGRPEGKRPLGRPMHTWKDYIKIIFKNGIGDMDLIYLVQ
jgi:hypothetical protein